VYDLTYECFNFAKMRSGLGAGRSRLECNSGQDTLFCIATRLYLMESPKSQRVTSLLKCRRPHYCATTSASPYGQPCNAEDRGNSSNILNEQARPGGGRISRTNRHKPTANKMSSCRVGTAVFGQSRCDTRRGFKDRGLKGFPRARSAPSPMPQQLRVRD
jgi:hypothetical protein